MATAMEDIQAPATVESITDGIRNIKVDASQLTPLSPEVIRRQATINIGTIGHVAHGKSTVVKAISGVQTVRFKNELVRNITIKLGYANAKIYKCDNPDCLRPGNYNSFPSDKEDHPKCEVPGCGGTYNLVRHVSFVDCPGHDILMATMLNGAAVMDAALLLVAANEPCPQPQTSEHLAAVEIMKLSHVLILQNKVDLIREEAAQEHWRQIKRFTHKTQAANSPIVPICAQLKYNIDAVLEQLVTTIPVPIRDFEAPARLIIIRSFDVNKPGAEVNELQGGVAGGSILRGVLKVGQQVEVRPGLSARNDKGELLTMPILTRVVSLHAEHNTLDFAVPGGLIGAGTKMDPTLCRGDGIVGQVLGEAGTLPTVYHELELSYFLLRRLLGVASDDKKQVKVRKLEAGEVLMLSIGSLTTGGRVLSIKADMVRIALTKPVCAEYDEKVALSRRVDKHWRLIGWGNVKAGQATPLQEHK